MQNNLIKNVMDINEILTELTANYFHSLSKDVQKESETSLYCIIKIMLISNCKLNLCKWIEFSINEPIEIQKFVSFINYKLVNKQFITFKEFSTFQKDFNTNNLPF